MIIHAFYAKKSDNKDPFINTPPRIKVLVTIVISYDIFPRWDCFGPTLGTSSSQRGNCFCFASSCYYFIF